VSVDRLPCPNCGSVNIADDYDSLVTSMSGIDRQGGWTECCDCGFEGPEVMAEGNDTENIFAMVWNAWNDSCRALATESATQGPLRMRLACRGLERRESGAIPGACLPDNNPVATRSETNGTGGQPVKRACGIRPRGDNCKPRRGD